MGETAMRAQVVALSLLSMAAVQMDCASAMPTEDTWSEAREPAVLLESPLFLDDGEQFRHGGKVSFHAGHYATLKQHVEAVGYGEQFIMKSMDGSSHLALKAIQVWEPGKKVTLANADGSLSEMEPPEMLHLHGSVMDDPDTFVLLNVAPGGSTGVMHRRESRLALELEQDEGIQDRVGSYNLGLYLDCDQECSRVIQRQAGSRGHSTSVTAYLTSLIAGVAVIYERDLCRKPTIAGMKLWNTRSPFDRGTQSLNAYRSEKGKSGDRSVAAFHLFTGIQEGGVAY